MSTMMPVLPLIPKLLRARGLDVSRKRLGQALLSGAIPGRLEQGRWILSKADVDAAERYFRNLAARVVERRCRWPGAGEVRIVAAC